MSKASDLARLLTSGSTSLHGEAGVTASGSTGLTTNLQQGLAKVWVNYTHTTTTAIRDSLNMSSITDNDTGSSTLTFANNMNNDDFAQSNGIGDFGTQFNNSTALGQDSNSSKTTALTKLHVAGQTANTPYDHHEANVIVHGDLA